MTCKLRIRTAGDLHRMLKEIDLLKNATKGNTTKAFQMRWDSWESKQKRAFVKAISSLCFALRPLWGARVDVDVAVTEES